MTPIGPSLPGGFKEYFFLFIPPREDEVVPYPPDVPGP